MFNKITVLLNINIMDILSKYMNYCLEQERVPTSVYKFCKSIDMEESDFYKEYPNLEVIPQHVFKAFLEHAIALIKKEDAYKEWDFRTKILSLYFTVFEMFTANRSYINFVNTTSDKTDLSYFKEFKKDFKHYIDMNFDWKGLDLQIDLANDIRDKSLSVVAWGQFVMVYKFWLNDSSKGFEKTDALIEKGVNSTMDLLKVTELSSVLDFGKFLWKEKGTFA